MKTLRLHFMWHMHQPYYKDDVAGEYTMPWVFLHAIKDYYELPWLAEGFTGIKATYNLVPSLMVQLNDYARSLEEDKLFALMAKDVATLNETDMDFLTRNCMQAAFSTMIHPLWRYAELFHKARTVPYLENGDLLDLEVLFLLAWCGNALRKRKEIRELLEQEQGYSQRQKLELMETLRLFTGEVLDYYAKWEKRGRISLFTTPFYHPILPLLLDPNAAREADERTPVADVASDFSSEAEWHVKEAVAYYQKTFGKRPAGFWPAEGSISEKALALLAKHQVSIALGDEDVLFKSIGGGDRRRLFRKYRLQTPEGPVTLLFRDKALSDLIGFTYARMPAEEAAADFVRRLREIYDGSDEDLLVSVFLDGENAWEHYPNNGRDFFYALYAALEHESWIRCVTAEEAVADDTLPVTELARLKPGSWIGGNFSTWMGHPEKNAGWELLDATYEAFLSFKDKLAPGIRAQAEKELRIAEGSDWFWWYGDDHYTPLAGEFDSQFRGHLINVYRLADRPVPAELFIPIKKSGGRTLHQPPTGVISPFVDGKMSSYFEWMGAGSYDFSGEHTVMAGGNLFLEKLHYGLDRHFLYFRIDVKSAIREQEKGMLEVQFFGDEKRTFRFPLALGTVEDEHFQAVLGDVIEMKVRFSSICRGAPEELETSITFKSGDTVLQRAPSYDTLVLETKEGFDAYWYI